jgi:hypothetical protein
MNVLGSEMRIKAGIDLVVHALQNVMPLINRDWKRESELPKQGISSLFQRTVTFRIKQSPFLILNHMTLEFQMSRDLDTLHSLFLKTASTLEQETHRRNRGIIETFEVRIYCSIFFHFNSFFQIGHEILIKVIDDSSKWSPLLLAYR